MKRRFFWSVFTVFFRLQIYEAIAAIFWQSASYVQFFMSLTRGNSILTGFCRADSSKRFRSSSGYFYLILELAIKPRKCKERIKF